MAEETEKSPKEEVKSPDIAIPKPGSSSKRELILIVKPEAGLRATPDGDVISIKDPSFSEPLSVALKSGGAKIETLFDESEEDLKNEAKWLALNRSIEVPDLSVYYRVIVLDEKMDSLTERLLQDNLKGVVESAYVKPPTKPAFTIGRSPTPPRLTADFTSRQGYLNPAPEGIDTRYAWNLPGGNGTDVYVFDLEWDWNLDHEDLIQKQIVLIGNKTGDLDDENHGTAVMGVLGAGHDGSGVDGICPKATLGAVSLLSYSCAGAIRIAIRRLIAADRIGKGDIILIEAHRPGPNSIVGGKRFQERVDQVGYIPVEWWQDEFDAIRYASTLGIIVVEPAGNGAQNLDDAIYDTPARGFPRSWKNPFNPANTCSGAIMVGAGEPPEGTHFDPQKPQSSKQYTDRARCGFSNYGARVDAQGWGWEVTSSGKGDWLNTRQRYRKNRWYTDAFNGTSSASPIVAGALACVQGVLHNAGKQPLDPHMARELIRNTGSPQQGIPGRELTQRIGNRPDLGKLIPEALAIQEPGEGAEKSIEVPEPSHICQVTEIIIRCGPPEAVKMLGGSYTINTTSTSVSSSNPEAVTPQVREQLKQLQKMTGDAPEELLEKIGREMEVQKFSEEIKSFAQELGINIPT